MLVNDGVLGDSAADPRPLIDSTLDMIGIGLCAPTSPPQQPAPHPI
jgi:hypothetical protein